MILNIVCCLLNSHQYYGSDMERGNLSGLFLLGQSCTFNVFVFFVCSVDGFNNNILTQISIDLIGLGHVAILLMFAAGYLIGLYLLSSTYTGNPVKMGIPSMKLCSIPSSCISL